MSEHQFRNTMFGGFNRQDVLDYLTSSAEKNHQELNRQRENNESLERDLATAREENAVLRAELSEVRQEREELSRRAERLDADLERVSESDKVSREEAERLRAELAEANRELESLRELVSKLSPDAEAYTAIKDRTAGMELEAHRRAQSVEARAKIQAGDLQRQMEQWMSRVEQQYAGLKAEVDNGVARANQQLQAAAGSLTRMQELMDEQQAALRRMAGSYADSAPGKKAEN